VTPPIITSAPNSEDGNASEPTNEGDFVTIDIDEDGETAGIFWLLKLACTWAISSATTLPPLTFNGLRLFSIRYRLPLTFGGNEAGWPLAVFGEPWRLRPTWSKPRIRLQRE
jgi:hypothetical protein